jgi:thioredoxin reductase (NADPH)
VIESASNVEVRYGVEVIGGDGRLKHLELPDRATGKMESLPAAGLLVLIGAEPFTEWLPDTVSRDRWGFVFDWARILRSAGRRPAPFLLETGTPGCSPSATCGTAR